MLPQKNYDVLIQRKLERSEKVNIESSLVAYRDNILHYSHNLFYLRRIKDWKPPMCQRTAEAVKAMRFPDQPRLSILQEQVLHKVKTHILCHTACVREENNTLHNPSQYDLEKNYFLTPVR